MKKLKIVLLLLSLFLIGNTSLYAIGWKYKYVPIDSITPKSITAYIDLDIKTDSIRIFIINQEINFGQEVFSGSTRAYNVRPLSGISKNNNKCVITDMKLNEISTDSLLVSCVLTVYNKDEELLAYYNKYEISLPRSSLKGIISGPTKGNRTTIKLLWGGLWIMIAGLSYFLYTY